MFTKVNEKSELKIDTIAIGNDRNIGLDGSVTW